MFKIQITVFGDHLICVFYLGMRKSGDSTE
jgi:hypothetical protein